MLFVLSLLPCPEPMSCFGIKATLIATKESSDAESLTAIHSEMNRVVHHLKQERTKAWMRTHVATIQAGAKATIASASARKQLLYIPRKTKEEIMALHEEDPQRWNATTLSTRFGTQAENVRSLLKLHALRKHREKQLQSCEEEERKRIEHLREKMLESWSGLAEFVMRSRQVADASRLASSQKDSEDAVQEGEGEGEDDDYDDNGVEEQTVAEEEDVRVEEMVNSEWGAFLEKEIESAAVDTPRKSTYAFVEIGKGDENVRRAVWIREGESGRLRLADEAERSLLLNQVRAKDSQAFAAK